MGDGHFGGDGSVAWEVNADQVRQHSYSSIGPRHTQTGIDETEDSPGDFTIVIKLPANANQRETVLNELMSQAELAQQGGGNITFKLPIVVNGQGDQVNISWDSKGATPSAVRST